MFRRDFVKTLACIFCAPKQLILPPEKKIVSSDQFIEIPLNRIIHEPWHRIKGNTHHMRLLIDSIEKSGLMSPILVREDKVSGYYRLINGSYRLHACWQIQRHRQHGIMSHVVDMDYIEALQYNQIVHTYYK